LAAEPPKRCSNRKTCGRVFYAEPESAETK
jgi:hypothetical protein